MVVRRIVSRIARKEKAMSKIDVKHDKVKEETATEHEALEMDDEMEVILQEDALPVGPGY